MTATDLLRTAKAARTPHRIRYLIQRPWAPTIPGDRPQWSALAVTVPTYFNGIPLRRIPSSWHPSDVEHSGVLDSWDEAAAWCDAHHRGLL